MSRVRGWPDLFPLRRGDRCRGGLTPGYLSSMASLLSALRLAREHHKRVVHWNFHD
jgi:hypothetical protein